MVFYAFLGTLIPLNFSLLHLFNALSYLLILNPLIPNPPKFSLIRLIPLKISLIRLFPADTPPPQGGGTDFVLW